MKTNSVLNNGRIVGRVKFPRDWFGTVERHVVAVLGEVNDWAAYVDYADQSDEDIRLNGSKLTKEEAMLMFPYLNPEAYRA